MAIDLKSLNHNQLKELIQRAEVRTEELAKERITKVREKVLNLLKAEGFTLDELFGAGKGRKTRRPAAAKYRNPADPAQTWSGRGKRPRWFNAALAAGKKEKDLLV
jgi:DNA-binding protein H-NS